MVLIIDTLPSIQTNLAKEDGETKDNFQTECFAFGKKIESKSAKKLFISQEKIWKRREKFFAFLIQ